jgi:hypothetical protein
VSADDPTRIATRRRRHGALLAMAATMLLGLASRRWPEWLPAALGKYPGDALWAAMVFFGWRATMPDAGPARVGAVALATSVAVEIAKLWQAPWLVQLRHTTLGHLLLGHVFSWQNLVAYTVGAASAAGLEGLVRTTRHRVLAMHRARPLAAFTRRPGD